MARKIMGWKTKGMNRDMSVSVFSADFAFENRNLRLSTNENNTLMSWVNEKGTSLLTMSIDLEPWKASNVTHDTGNSINGIPIGTAIINNQLVIFTTGQITEIIDEIEVTHNVDRIYVLEYNKNKASVSDSDLVGTRLYKGNLNFSVDYPLETLVSYEAEHIQKVYWTDSLNQPRLININDRDHLKRWNHVISNTAHPSSTSIDTFFDFVPTLSGGDITVDKNVSGSGLFAPGVIQYCFAYLNKHAQETNIVAVSPIYYLAFNDRGASPEEKVSCSFEIHLTNLDNNFDKVRLYSIQRTSLNLEPIVRQLKDIKIEEIQDPVPIPTPIDYETTYSYYADYIDNGTGGTSMDPTELLYIGGKEITVLTMADKDQTLFMGNFVQEDASMGSLQSYITSPPSGTTIPSVSFAIDTDEDQLSSISATSIKRLPLKYTESTGSIYYYDSTLGKNQSEITTFKGNEWYRFGFQLQKDTGEWTEPIFLNDAKNSYYPGITKASNIANSTIRLPYAKITGLTIPETLEGFSRSKFKKIRPLVVYPNIVERNVLCQGVLNPTVVNVRDRWDHSPDAQASWFFRPFIAKPDPEDPNIDYSGGLSKKSILESVTYTTGSSASYNPQSAEEYDDVYILQANVFDNDIDRVLSSKSLEYRSADNKEAYDALDYQSEDLSFYGAIRISGPYTVAEGPDNGKTYYTYVFVRKGLPWYQEFLLPDPISNEEPTEQGGSGGGGGNSNSENQNSENLDQSETQGSNSSSFDPENFGGYARYADAFSVTVQSAAFHLNKEISSVYGYLCYTTSDRETAPLNKVFSYYLVNSSTWYNVTFDRILSVEVNRCGTHLAYEHNEVLPCRGEGDSIFGSNHNRRVEIQGATDALEIEENNEIKINKDSHANTQFVVDQSIVTLNSPDIEFDTDVQNYAFEGNGLKLRVVGVIPITSSVSAHSIRISTPMLETSHNLDDDDFSKGDAVFGQGELATNVCYINTSTNKKAGNRLVSEYLWNDVLIQKDKDTSNTEGFTTNKYLRDYMIYPWHKSGALNNDFRSEDKASSVLKTKKESNIMFSDRSDYSLVNNLSNVYTNIATQLHLTENEFIQNIRLKSPTRTLNYYPNIDKVLYNELRDVLQIRSRETLSVDDFREVPSIARRLVYSKARWLEESSINHTFNTVVSMKYKSTSHAVIALPSDAHLDYKASGATHPIVVQDEPGENYLLLGELYKDVNTSPFKDTQFNTWTVGGDTVDIPANGTVNLLWTIGDTYYQRYDCLKTYAFTNEDPNQIIEILSFMCETHVNIDGRYDRNRGQIDNTNMRPQIFNLLNPVYSQQDNFFNYQKLGIDKRDTLTYPNQVTYSKTKISGADVDLWTNVTLASVLELDGDKGQLNKLTRMSDQIFAFQDTGISQILYNDNVAIATQQGVPIEIANSGKVQGKRYINDTIGCSNKWSLVNTPSGIYFMDSIGKNIFLFNGQLTNLSGTLGFNTWCKQNIPSSNVEWTPKDYDSIADKGFKNFVAHYDKKNQEVLFINKDIALAYSEKLTSFTSFYNYGMAPYFCNLDDTGIWLSRSRASGAGVGYLLWKHQDGDYCNIFNNNYPYSMTLIANGDPQWDKIFSNLEFKACVDGDGTAKTGDSITFDKFYLPFDTFETWNEYQHGLANLDIRNGHDAMKHHTLDNNATLKRKFRIWRCDVPRDNAELNTDDSLPTLVSRFKKHPLDRMRNPWIYLKLEKDIPTIGTLKRAEIHDILMSYYL